MLLLHTRRESAGRERGSTGDSQAWRCCFDTSQYPQKDNDKDSSSHDNAAHTQRVRAGELERGGERERRTHTHARDKREQFARRWWKRATGNCQGARSRQQRQQRQQGASFKFPFRLGTVWCGTVPRQPVSPTLQSCDVRRRRGTSQRAWLPWENYIFSGKALNPKTSSVGSVGNASARERLLLP